MKLLCYAVTLQRVGRRTKGLCYNVAFCSTSLVLMHIRGILGTAVLQPVSTSNTLKVTLCLEADIMSGCTIIEHSLTVADNYT